MLLRGNSLFTMDSCLFKVRNKVKINLFQVRYKITKDLFKVRNKVTKNLLKVV